jgi:hypothetical protein
MGVSVPELRHGVHAYEALARCDLVHDHSVAGPFYAARHPGLPVVTTNHAPFNEEMNELYRAMQVPVIAISRAQAAEAVGVRIAGVVHHGLDVVAFPVGAGDGCYFLFLGRMAPEKGARRAALVAQRAGVPLVMAAKMHEPLERAYFEDQVRPLLSRDIVFVAVPDEETGSAFGPKNGSNKEAITRHRVSASEPQRTQHDVAAHHMLPAPGV